MEEKCEEIVSKMTVEEKASFLVGVGMPGIFDNPPSKVDGVAGETHSIDRLKIPSVRLADGPAGLRIKPKREETGETYYATAFPIASMLASTWNKEIVERVGMAMGNETKEYGVDILLAPALNIHRNPLCGRNFEYYSEDPILSGEMAAAFVKGVQSQGVGACVKHFVANEQETGRMQIDTIVSQRALREIYLKAFEIVVKKASPWSVMSAYNKLNGTYCSQNYWLLTEVLRKDWGFEGFVMTDWYAGDNPIEQIKAGNDMIMPGKAYQAIPFGRKDEVEEILKAVRSGELKEQLIDQAVRNILRVLIKTPSFENYSYSNKPNLTENAKISYEAGCEGAVLLKNDMVLPISLDTKLAVFGTGQLETVKGGTGSGDTNPRYVINIIDGLKETGLKVDEKLRVIYENYIEKMRQTEEYKIQQLPWGWPLIPLLPQDFLSDEDIEKFASSNDMALLVISRTSGEGYDRKPEKGDFYLSDDETNLINRVSSRFRSQGKKVIVVLNIGGVMEIASWRDKIDAIVLLWQAGQETGKILGDLLVGKVNPSGKLPTTFPKDYSHIPSKNFPGEPADDPLTVSYDEDIYVGYRYYDTFRVEPAYEFGYGLSYTTFRYDNLNVSPLNNSIKISFEIKNVGSFAGREAAQVYIKAPLGKIGKPLQELKAFHKTKLLKPGEVEKIELSIDLNDLRSFSGSDWIFEKGEYELRVGSSSRDIRLRSKILLN